MLTYAAVCCVGGRLDAHMNALGAWTANTFHALVMDIEGALLETEPAMGLVLQVLLLSTITCPHTTIRVSSY